MLGGGKPSGDDDDKEDSLSETKSRAEDAAMAFASAIEAKDAKRIVATCRSLYTLCAKLDELSDAGEMDEDDDKKDEESKESDEAAEE